MTTEAERLAEVFETFSKDHKPDGWPAIQQHFLSEAAALLRQQAAEIERLQSCGNGAGCLYKDSMIESQAAEIERLKATPPDQREDLRCVIADLTRQCQESDALLSQALEALAKYTTPGVLGGRVPIDAELVTAIKQHLEQT